MTRSATDGDAPQTSGRHKAIRILWRDRHSLGVLHTPIQNRTNQIRHGLNDNVVRTETNNGFANKSITPVRLAIPLNMQPEKIVKAPQIGAGIEWNRNYRGKFKNPTDDIVEVSTKLNPAKPTCLANVEPYTFEDVLNPRSDHLESELEQVARLLNPNIRELLFIPRRSVA